MRNSVGYEGSGMRAVEDSDRARKEIEQKIEGLAARAAGGENVDAEMRQLKDRMDRLSKDRGDIEAAGMV